MELLELALTAFRSGDNARAEHLAQQALLEARRTEDRVGHVDALCMLARVALRGGDLELMETRASEARAVAQGEARLERMPIHIQAVVARMRGDLAAARELYQASIDLNESLGEERMVAAEHHNLGYVELHDGNIERARALFGEARRLSVLSGFEGLFPHLVVDAAVLTMVDGDPSTAARLAGSASAAFGSLGQMPDPDDAAEQDRLRDRLIEALGEEHFTRMFEAGEGLSLEEALGLSEHG